MPLCLTARNAERSLLSSGSTPLLRTNIQKPNKIDWLAAYAPMANGHRGPRRVTISEATKLRWFQRGAKALAATFPSAAGKGYACPICARATTSVEALTVEDVPPRRVGGKPLILTCEPCNSKGGRLLDVHWGHLLDVESLMRGELSQALTVQLDIGGARTTAELTAEGKIFKAAGMKAASNPAAIEAQKQTLSKLLTPTGMTTAIAFNMTLSRSRFKERNARLSILRAGYLVGVAVTGYRFLPSWRRIRELVFDPSGADDDLLQLVRFDKSHPLDRRQLGVIFEPSEAWALLVGFGSWTVIVPFAVDSIFYSPERRTGRWAFTGSEYEWPTEPSFGIPSE